MTTIRELKQRGKDLSCRISKLADDSTDGVWRTVRGRRVFIREGEDFDSALKRSLGGEGENKTFSPVLKEADAKTSVTMGGWRTNQGDIEYGKLRPITRGQGSYYFLKVGGKERRFKDSGGSRGPNTPEARLQAAVEKLGLKYVHPPQEQLNRPRITG